MINYATRQKYNFYYRDLSWKIANAVVLYFLGSVPVIEINISVGYNKNVS